MTANLGVVGGKMEFFVKGVLILYGFAFIGIFIVLWQNSYDVGNAKNLTIIFSSLAAIFAITFPYIKMDRMSDGYNYVLFLDRNSGNILSGECPNPYESRYLNMFVNTSGLKSEYNSKSPFEEMMGEKGLRIVEYGILNAMLVRFRSDWDINVQKQKILMGTQESWAKAGDGKKGAYVSSSSLREYFSFNPIVASKQTIVSPGFWLPPGSKLKVVTPEKNTRDILIEGDRFKTKIRIFATMGRAIPNKISGIINRNYKGIDLLGFNYSIGIETYISPRILSHRDRNKLKKWHVNLSEVLSVYDWERVEEDVDKKMYKQAAEKILGI